MTGIAELSGERAAVGEPATVAGQQGDGQGGGEEQEGHGGPGQPVDAPGLPLQQQDDAGRAGAHHRAEPGRDDAAQVERTFRFLSYTPWGILRRMATALDTLRMWSARRWLIALAAGLATALVVALPTAVIPNPVFGRTIETTWWSYPVVVITGVLGGLLIATYVREPLPGGDGH